MTDKQWIWRICTDASLLRELRTADFVTAVEGHQDESTHEQKGRNDGHPGTQSMLATWTHDATNYARSSCGCAFGIHAGDRREMRGFSVVAVVLLVIAFSAAPTAASTTGKLPPPARVGCGDSGVATAGFTVYSCGSGAGGTKYAHLAELLVVRADGSFTGYPDAFGQADIVRTSATRGVVASHNNGIDRVTASALISLVSERQLERLVADSTRLGAITALTVDSYDDILLHANYYADDRRGCENARVELMASGHLRVLSRSASGLTCE